MKVKREQLLKSLLAVSAGLSKREIIEQSNTFVFTGNKIVTFNDEVSCSVDSPVDLEGSIPAELLISTVKKWDAEELEVVLKDGKVIVSATTDKKQQRATIVCQNEIRLPVDDVEKPDKWKKLPKEFEQVIALVQPCAGSDGSKFLLTCVHFDPEFVEASDDMSACRFQFNFGLQGRTIVRASTIKSVIGMKVTKFCETDNWFHFGTEDGVVISCRRYVDQYPSKAIDNALEYRKGVPISFPKKVTDTVENCKPYIGEDENSRIEVALGDGGVQFRGEGALGAYRERQRFDYKGESVKFKINPELLLELSRRGGDYFISDKLIRVESGSYTYLSCIVVD